MRDNGPTVFASIRNDEGVTDIVDLILSSFKMSGADRRSKGKGRVM
jgi:urease accessory protein